METKQFDIVVIGGGPGGYPAAIKAAQSGKSVALVEAKELGGTCLNRGCIPSKTLIAGAEVLERTQHANEFGITVGKVTFDYGKMAARKDRIVDDIRKGLEGLISSNQITLFRGHGQFVSPDEIKVLGQDNALLKAKKVIIATGSEPRSIAAFPCDYKKIHDSTSLLAMTTLPKSIVIVGGGVIGCEFASLYAALGVDVTILELMPRLIPMEATAVSEALEKAFKKKGIKISLNAQVQSIDTKGKGVAVKLSDAKSIDAEIALISIGRTLNTSKIGLDKAGIAVNNNGTIPVNEKMETEIPGIYAVGDIASKWWLAHVASHQGVVAATNATGGTAHMNYNAVPSVIYTHPEIATVGLSLEAAQNQGYKAEVAAFPFAVLGKSQAALQTDGFTQIVMDKATGQILGAQVVGYEASTLIAEMAVAIANELTLDSITETIHAHPTIAEAWLEAAFVGTGAPLHMPPKRKKN